MRTCIEGIPRIFRVHSVSNPLGYNFLLSFKDGASRMLRESSIHYLRLRVNIGEKNGITKFWFHMHASISEICMPSK